MIQAVLLLAAGIAFEFTLTALAAAIPGDAYFETSFTVAALAATPMLALAALVGFSPVLLWRSTVIRWDKTDSIGGLRFVVFGIAASLAWSHAAYPFNYYYGEAHAFDRWLLIALLFTILRSPIFVPLFALEMVISRGQLQHPIATMSLVAEELPLRILGIVALAGLWNVVVEWSPVAKLLERAKALLRVEAPAAIAAPAIVFAMLCLVGSYYGHAGLAKLRIGESPLDWANYSHMENLFVGAYAKGWQWVGDYDSMLAFADIVQAFSTPLALATIALEIAMVLVFAHRIGSIVLVISIFLMHLGIVAVSGIFFWQWVVVDAVLALWLFWFRNEASLDALYAGRRGLGSIAIIVFVMWAFPSNDFTWWNTKWYSVLEVEVLDKEGKSYRVARDDFGPYLFSDYIRPPGTLMYMFGFGSTPNQQMMEQVEITNPEALQTFIRQHRVENLSAYSPEPARRDIDDFMTRYFRNRNRRTATNGGPSDYLVPFVLPAPLTHLRWYQADDFYRDQAPVVAVRIRHIEMYYTGDGLAEFGNQVLHTIRIPDSP